MAHQVYKDCRFWVDQYDLSGDINSHTVTFTQDAVDKTTFGSSGVREYLPGLRSATHTHTGFAEPPDAADSPYDALSANESVIVTVAPTTDVEGGASVSYQSIKTSFSALEGSVGGMSTFTFSGQPTAPAVPGLILAPKATRNSSSNTTGVTVGAITSSQVGYAALHVFSGSASTLAVKIQSDTAGFGSPTDQITFSTATPSTNLSQWGTVAGAVTDTLWRVVWTIGGGSWSFAVTFGIM